MYVLRRTIEKYEASKHQSEIILALLRYVYQGEALAQIQCYVSLTRSPVPGFVRFENILQQESGA